MSPKKRKTKTKPKRRVGSTDYTFTTITLTPEPDLAAMTTAPTPPAPPDTRSPFEHFWLAIKPMVDAEIETRVRAISSDGIKVEWKSGGLTIAKSEGKHHRALGEVLLRINAGIKNIMLVGPSGSGKTRLAEDVAKALGLPFSEVSCTAGMPEWHLVGRATPNLQTGENRYEPSQSVKSYEGGGLALWDEFDAADPNTVLIANSALSNGHWALPARQELPLAARHPNHVLIVAANTWGRGATRMFAGRNQLDAATLSRFACAEIFVDYDRELEAGLVEDKTILKRVWAIREKVEELKLHKTVGTRELVNVARLVASGQTLEWAIGALTTSWTTDERTRVGVVTK